LKGSGVTVRLGIRQAPATTVDLVVLSPGVPSSNPVLQELKGKDVPVISELELGYQHSLCLNVAITGTNGKTTTTELVERLLRRHDIRTMAAGNIGVPVCSVVERTRELDFLTLEVSSFQLESINFFRPVIAVLMNLCPDHLDRYANMTEYALAKARIFMNQQPFDWAIVQSEAMASG
jgi:UDP-N-acetylmuramoylalanine--D-glutamate ligase